MDKAPHMLTPIKAMRYPRRIVFFDSESYLRKPEDYFDSGHALSENLPMRGARTTHEPRLISTEFWQESPITGDLEQMPLEPTVRDSWAKDTSPEGCCKKFWTQVSDFAIKPMAGGEGKKERPPTYVMAHNAGYDMLATGGYKHLASLGWQMTAVYEKGPVYILRLTRNKRSMIVLSSTNFWATSLKKLGDTFGVPKLDTDTQTESDEELVEYCHRDVEVLRLAMLFLIDRLKHDPNYNAHGEEDGTTKQLPWADTISSVAFKAFRTAFNHYDIVLHIDPEATMLERDSYCGGRTEAGFIGELEPPVFDLDVNSLYPSVMWKENYPCELTAVMNPSVEQLEDLLDRDELVIAAVEVDITEPCVPMKAEKLLFPVGRFVTTLCSPELNLVRAHGRIVDVDKVAIYRKGRIFQNYVEWSNRMKEKASLEKQKGEAKRQLGKNLGNNLYGKFGQMGEEWERLGDAEPNEEYVEERFDVETQRTYTLKVYGGGMYVSYGGRHESYNSFPAIASFVTSYARAHLWRIKQVAKECFYTDTDSIFVSEAGYENLKDAGMMDDTRMGALKPEMVEREDTVEIFGAKAYRFGKKLRFKGVPLTKAKKMMVPEKIRGGDVEHVERYVYEQFSRFDSGLRRRNVHEASTRVVYKKTDVDYTKGFITEDGWVLPWEMPRQAEEAGVVLRKLREPPAAEKTLGGDDVRKPVMPAED